MILDFSDLIEVGTKQEFTNELSVDHIDFRNKEIEVKGPLKVRVDVLKAEDSFVLSGKIEGTLILQCSRCLKYFDYTIEVEISDEMLIEDIEDLHKVNIFPVLISDIILEIPIKPLHDSECKGLCSKCGQDLNEGECACEIDTVDPRLAKLKDFKDN